MLKLDINLVFTILNVLILFVLVRKFLFKPVHNILDARQAEIDKQYEDVKAAQDAADALKAKYETSVKDIAKEKEEILNDARDRANGDYEKVLADAKTQADKIVEDARKDADELHQKRMQQATEQIADLVVSATAKIVASHQGMEADRELYNQFLAKTGEKSE
ncbi:MAG: F0F1 ATP synthase subunit B [Bacteroidales bacterium]|nr:F0F1 ATP synthase subunit B [Lachnoclostridium sp.]MCM1384827.1 F0F1 ATP synthase subunit B [Lachnoclostridium sp.]MCM1466428.1 F0F1 ATP synthase subunit B [Bacteroidales bacterium]